MAKVRLNKDGTVDKRYGKKTGKIQEVIDSQQAPGLAIAAHHKADYNPDLPCPNTPIDHSKRTQRGADWDVDRQRENKPQYRNPEL